MHTHTFRSARTESTTFPGMRTVAGAAMGLAYYLFCRATTPADGIDFMDSPLYAWGWLVLPILAFALARTISDWGAMWGVLLVLPQAAAVVFGRHLLWFASDGRGPGGIAIHAQLDTSAVYLVLLHAIVAAGVGAFGASWQYRRNRS